MYKRQASIVAAVADDTEPFSLGFEGEVWDYDLPALLIPVPGTDRSLAVVAMSDGNWGVVTLDDWKYFDSLLTLAAFVHEFITPQGNNTREDT